MDFDQKIFVLGVGAQKAGTTWLFDYLSKRGDIFMPRKEMHYFNIKHKSDRKRHPSPDFAADGSPATAGKYRSYREYYRTRVPEECNHFGEITPAYAILNKAKYRHIRTLFANIRIIFIMRDPVDRFLSQVRMFQENVRRR